MGLLTSCGTTRWPAPGRSPASASSANSPPSRLLPPPPPWPRRRRLTSRSPAASPSQDRRAAASLPIPALSLPRRPASRTRLFHPQRPAVIGVVS
ncbi:hypothetical protein ACMD2_17570 [Ananas comosus]|uniref:Uncharacterized protein n=1 Tax=Ananas comosus TaxID=4615 RepID=A0A199UN60_ANACO|nr:hypothetical protein ACMD2_17570 [Ananas comosus]